MPDWIDPKDYPNPPSSEEVFHTIASAWTIEVVDGQFVVVTKNEPKVTVAVFPRAGSANCIVHDHNTSVRRHDVDDLSVEDRAKRLAELVGEVQQGLTGWGILQHSKSEPIQTSLAIEAPKAVVEAAERSLNESHDQSAEKMQEMWEEMQARLGAEGTPSPIKDTFGAFVVKRDDGAYELRVFRRFEARAQD